MGLAATIASAVGAGFAALGDVVQAATYQRRTATAYSIATGLATETFTNATVGAIITDYTRKERVDAAIQPEDRKALVRGAELAADPAIGDRLVVGGQTLDVVGVSTDPIEAVWVLQVRRAA